MKKSIFTLFFLSLFTPLCAAEVSGVQALSAVKSWQRNNAKAFNREFRTPDGKVFSFMEKGVAKSHIVMLDGGGFVVTSGDDADKVPIKGFSSSGSFDPSESSPLRDIIVSLSTTNRTITSFLAKGAGNEETGFALQSYDVNTNDYSLSSEASQGWSELLNNRFLARSFIYCVDDLRVDSLIKSKWSQGSLNGSINIWNYYTPNNYPCGCVATMMAQVMRYHSYPSQSIAKVYRQIKVNNVNKYVTTQGGVYDWEKMPLIPNTSITEEEKQAIGKIVYDCGVSVNMEYTSKGSGALPTVVPDAMTDIFKYSSCKYMMRMDVEGITIDQEKNSNAILANLNAGYPVMLAILSSVGGHAVIADGYGYIDDVLYTHINLGWYGQGDSWFNLPDIDCTSLNSSFDFSIIYALMFNVFPEKTGEIVSGRVIDVYGNPMENVEITLTGNGKTFTTKTSATGVWGVVADANTTYEVVASTPGFQSTTIASTTSSSTSSYDDSIYMTVGNVWDCDFTLNETQMERISIGDFSSVNGDGSGAKTFSCTLPEAFYEVTVMYCEKLGDEWKALSSGETILSAEGTELTINLDVEKSSRPSGFFYIKARK